jgi:hypothetical protein
LESWLCVCVFVVFGVLGVFGVKDAVLLLAVMLLLSDVLLELLELVLRFAGGPATSALRLMRLLGATLAGLVRRDLAARLCAIVGGGSKTVSSVQDAC